MFMKWFWLASAGLLAVGAAASAVVSPPHVLPRAHAHNDYEHPRPLLDALDHGFLSVEADIHLVDGQLLVAHDADEVQPHRTLQKLYLDPLRQRIAANDGWVYPGVEQPLLLLIDFKTDAETTYPALRNALADYAALLTTTRGHELRRGPLLVVLTGKRPVAQLKAETTRYAFLDGRIGELTADPSPALVPLVSDNGGRRFDWRDDGSLPPDQVVVLNALVKHIQARGHRVRFWATPDKPKTWQILHAAGVDYINTDNLSGLRRFLTSKHQSQE